MAVRLSRLRFARYNAAANTGAPQGGRRHSQPALLKDMADGGDMHVYGTVTLVATGALLARKVRLYDKPSGRLLRETVSAENGAYAFEHLRDGVYFVLAHDHTGNYNAVIADAVTPEPMP